MRIVVNDIAASTGGALTVLHSFYQEVMSHDDNHTWIFLTGDPTLIHQNTRIQVICFPHIKNSRLKRMIFDLISGKKILDSLHPDVIFSLQNTIIFGAKCRQVLYIHQPIPFQSVKQFSLFQKEEAPYAVYQHFIGKIIKFSASHANHIIVQTQWMCDAVTKCCKVDRNKIAVIPPDPAIAPVTHCSDDLFDYNSFFYPSSDVIYKNNNLLIESVNRLVADGYKPKLEITIQGESNSYVKYLGRIDYSNVLKRYSRNTLVFPSYIETFGYPLVEAKEAGTIILASDTSFAHELLDGYENAYYFPFNDKDALVKLMKDVMDKKILRKNIERHHTEKTANWERVYNLVTSNDKQ